MNTLRTLVESMKLDTELHVQSQSGIEAVVSIRSNSPHDQRYSVLYRNSGYEHQEVFDADQLINEMSNLNASPEAWRVIDDTDWQAAASALALLAFGGGVGALVDAELKQFGLTWDYEKQKVVRL